MNNIDKDKVLNILKDSVKKVKDTSKKMYNQVSTDIYFIKECNQFNIIKKGDKDSNRPIFAIYDEVNNVMYLKEIDLIQKRKHIEEKYILKDKKDKKYEIIKIEENKFDYLLKSKKGYKTISCYKILLKRI